MSAMASLGRWLVYEEIIPWMELPNKALTRVVGFLSAPDLSRAIVVSRRMWGVAMQEHLWRALLVIMTQSWDAAARDELYAARAELSSAKLYAVAFSMKCHCCGRACTKKADLGKVGMEALENMKIRMCTKCQPEHLVTRSAAKSSYLLTEKMLKEIPHTSRKWYGKTCTLYAKQQVIALSMRRWKSQSGLESERLKRKVANPVALPPWKRLGRTRPAAVKCRPVVARRNSIEDALVPVPRRNSLEYARRDSISAIPPPVASLEVGGLALMAGAGFRRPSAQFDGLPTGLRRNSLTDPIPSLSGPQVAPGYRRDSFADDSLYPWLATPGFRRMSVQLGDPANQWSSSQQRRPSVSDFPFNRKMSGVLVRRGSIEGALQATGMDQVQTGQPNRSSQASPPAHHHRVRRGSIEGAMQATGFDIIHPSIDSPLLGFWSADAQEQASLADSVFNTNLSHAVASGDNLIWEQAQQPSDYWGSSNMFA